MIEALSRQQSAAGLIVSVNQSRDCQPSIYLKKLANAFHKMILVNFVVVGWQDI